MQVALQRRVVAFVLTFLCSALPAQANETILPPLTPPSKNTKELDTDLVILGIRESLPIAEKKNISGESVLITKPRQRNDPEIRICIFADDKSYPGITLEDANQVLSSMILPWLGKSMNLTQKELKLHDDCLTNEQTLNGGMLKRSPFFLVVERKFLPNLLEEQDFKQDPQMAFTVGAVSKESFFANQRLLAEAKQRGENAMRSNIKALAEAAKAGEVATLGSLVIAAPDNEIRLCAVSTGESDTPFLLGYSFSYLRLLPDEWVRDIKSKNPKATTGGDKKYYHKTFGSLDTFYIKLRESGCHVFVGTPVDVHALREALLRDTREERNLIGRFVQKTELAENWAKVLGFDSYAQSVFAGKFSMDTATVKGLAEYQVTSEESLLAVLATMRSAGYADNKDPKTLLSFLRDKQAGEREGKTAVAIRTERQQKEVRDAERRALEQKKAREEYAKRFPFTAIISCSLGESSPVTLNACFVNKYNQTELEVKNGADYRMYTVRDLFSAGQATEEGLEIPLQKSFQIKAQNAGEGLLLTVKIIDNKSGSVAFKKSASQYGVVRVTN